MHAGIGPAILCREVYVSVYPCFVTPRFILITSCLMCAIFRFPSTVLSYLIGFICVPWRCLVFSRLPCVYFGCSLCLCSVLCGVCPHLLYLVNFLFIFLRFKLTFVTGCPLDYLLSQIKVRFFAYFTLFHYFTDFLVCFGATFFHNTIDLQGSCACSQHIALHTCAQI